ncbi:ABC transporter [Eubacterium callanderi]|nr:ATP-binding cassette domain-containing protein [Eubacterium callanderi]SFO56922.1 ABC transporter [Eubacterium callanderi]
MNEKKLVEIRNLKKYYRLDRHTTVKAVDGVSFDILKGEIFGLVGESGSGKSTTGKALMHLFEPTDGSVCFDGMEISDKSVYRKNRSRITGEMQMIFQDAASAVNTRMTIGEIIAEPFRIRSRKAGKKRFGKKQQSSWLSLDSAAV